MAKEATELRLIVTDLRGGRNGTEPPLTLKEPQETYQGSLKSGVGECYDANNVDWDDATFAHKRFGASAFPLSGVASAPSPITGVVSFLGRFVPNSDDTQAQLWMADDASPNPNLCFQQFGGSPGLVKPTILDPITGKGWDLQGASIKGKYMLCYQSGQPRLHCWDGTSIRRTGLGVPAAPTVADTGSGTYAAVKRWYRVRWLTYSFGPPAVVIRRSEPGPATAFTPSGTGTAALITFPPVIGEGETHWELEVSLDNVTFFVVGPGGIAALTYADTNPPAFYAANTPVSPATGVYGLQKAYRFIAVDQNRLLGFGSFTATDPQNRLEYSAVGGSTNVSDEERVPLNNYIDMDEADSGPPTGIAGPVYGAFYLFKYRQVWKLVPTGNSAQPYTLFPLSKIVGAIHQNAIEVGEDASGNPMVYFVSARGPYRIGLQGLEYLGLPSEDLWLGPNAKVGLNCPTVVAHAVYHTEKRQMWIWFATEGVNDPNIRMIFDVRRSAWARNDGLTASARCSLMVSNTLATASSRDLKPYIGQADGVGRVWKCDDPTQTTDVGTPFRAWIFTKPYMLGGAGAYCTVGQGTIIAKAASGVTISLTIWRDTGVDSQSSSAVLTPVAGESRVQRLFDAASMSGAWAVAFMVGDLAPVANNWTIDMITLNYVRNEALV